MKTHTVQVDHLFNGEISYTSQHKVSSMVGLIRILRGFLVGDRHGIRISVSWACAADLGLREAGGSIWASAYEIAIGSIKG